MHEAGLIQSMLGTAEREARRAGGSRIELVRLRVGRLSAVVPEALEHAFAVLKAGTMARDAALEVEYVPGLLFCATCERDFSTDDMIGECPTCGAPSGFVKDGMDVQLVSLEVS
jgi:hydrogenase nickel incorporation protein HypA/HybF